MKESLSSAKLPSIADVLRRYLHLLQTRKNKHDAATCTMMEVQKVWEKARIPMRRIDHAVQQLEDLVKQWEMLKKNKAIRTPTQVSHEEAFVETFNDLFDVAHQDALVLIKIPEDKAFLLAQREKGRRGVMAGVDLSLTKKERTEARKRENEHAWEEKQSAEMKKYKRDIVLESSNSSSSSNSDNSMYCEVLESNTEVISSLPKRGRRNILTPSVLSSLDRTKITDRQAVQVITPIIQASGHSIKEYSINRSTIRRSRQQHRAKRTAELKAEFNAHGPMVLHWDGKLMEDISGEQKVDRLPIVISASGVEKLLCIPKLASGTGQAMADAIFKVVSDWGVTDNIKAFSFDTTASNTGKKNGACVLLERLLQREVLHLACRHHIHEILLQEAFRITLGPSTSPQILLFKRFQVYWCNIVPTSYKPGVEDPLIAATLSGVSADVTEFVITQLGKDQQRDDYKELLELALLFLGKVPPRGVFFMKPGAIHRARFMARLIYSLKIFMFRDAGFPLTEGEVKGLGDFCVFGLKVYIKSWFLSRLSTAAPANDLHLLKHLSTIDSPSAKAALRKMCGQLWYLNEELVALAFFDRDVDGFEKRAMIEALKHEGKEYPPKRISVEPSKITEKRLRDFVTKNTRNFFRILSLPDSFLETDPDTWDTNPDYLLAENVVKELRVVNDTAERGVALMQDYNALFTKNEEQTQFILQVVSEHRKYYPDSKKSTLLQVLAPP
jgi:hypothetical protein